MSYQCDQRKDDLLFFRETAEAYVRWLYARSYESRSKDSKGQDFLAWHYVAERQALDFVICDGVGSSFCGHVAAQELGNKLLNHFLMHRWADLERLSNDSAVAELAMGQLNDDWKKLAQKKVAEEPLPTHLSEMVRTALEQQRDQIGSETIFLCGHLALEAGVRKLILLWMGDTQVRLFDQNGQPIPVEGRWVNSDRWSTLRGTRGQVNVRIFRLDDVNLERIIAFSDGLASVADTVHQLDDSALQETVATLFTSPTSDDISFIDIRLKRPAQSDRLAIPTIAHKGNTVDWESIPDATSYAVEKANNGLFYHAERMQQSQTQWPLPSPSESHYCYVRVQAVGIDGKTGGWSNILRIEPTWTLQAPDTLTIEPTEDPATYTLRWSPVAEARYYVVLETRGAHKREYFVNTECHYEVTNPESGLYQYQVASCGRYGEQAVSAPKDCEVPPGSAKNSADENTSSPSPNVMANQAPSQSPKAPQAFNSAFQSDDSTRPTQVMAIATNNLPSSGVVTQQLTIPTTSRLGTPKIGTIERVSEGQPFTLRWSVVQGAQGYELQMARSNIQADMKAFVPIYEGDKTEYSDQIAEAGERFYRVRALSTNTEPSPWSAVCVVTIGQPDTLQPLASRQQYIAQQPISQPNRQSLGIPYLTLRDHVKNGQYVLDWTFVSDATGYEWQEETLLPNGGRTFVRGDKTAPQQRSMSLINKEGTYYYRVRAFNQNSFGEYSDKLEVKVRKSLIENFKQSAKDLITFGSSTSSQIRQANIKLTVDLGSSNQVAVGQSYRLSWSCAVPVDVFEVRRAKLAKPGQLPRDNDYEWVTDTHEWYVTLSHRSPGLRYLRVRAIDKNRYPSEWSEPLQIEVVETLQYQRSSIQPQLAVWSLENIRRSCNVTPNWVEIRLEWRPFSSWYLLSRQTAKGTENVKTSEHYWNNAVIPGTTRFKVYAVNDRGQLVGEGSEYLVVTVRKVQPEQLVVDINTSKG